ncbi:MAG: aspartate aminotransferase family protein [Patescibacteria group bacterium]
MDQALQQKDSRYFGRGFPLVPIEIVKAKDSFLYDTKGKKYIDFLMGWCVGNIGWGVKEIRNAIKNFDGPEYIRPFYLYKPWVELAQLLAKITPGKLTKSYPATGGTEAVEIALQAAMSYTKRSKFISIEGSYHGHSIGAMSVGSSGFRKHYVNLLPGCYKIKPPLNAKAAREAEELLQKGDIAGFIMEPIVCNLGVLIPNQEFFEIITNACKRYGTVFIIDEVATGFGRCGKMFAAELFDLKPDIMTFAKGITGGYAALGATITTEEVAKSMDWEFSFYSTYGWHPTSVEAALATIKYMLNNEEKLFKHIEELGKFFEDNLKKIQFRYKAWVRIKGLAVAVEFEEKDLSYTRQIIERCREKGLLITDEASHILTFFPALTIDKKTAGEGLRILESCV